MTETATYADVLRTSWQTCPVSPPWRALVWTFGAGLVYFLMFAFVVCVWLGIDSRGKFMSAAVKLDDAERLAMIRIERLRRAVQDAAQEYIHHTGRGIR